MGEPDQIVYMRDEPFDVPAEGTVDYQYFTVDPGWETEKWIIATKARPGNRAVVHHNVVWVNSGPGSEVEPTQAIAWYGPGFLPFYCAPGTALYVPAHAKLQFSMHYTPNGTAQSDRSMVGIRFADLGTVKKLARTPYMTDRTLKIPPGDPNYQAKDERTVWQDLLVYGLLPHMHLRGKSFLCEAEYAGGRREILLDVPRYDPNWQLHTFLPSLNCYRPDRNSISRHISTIRPTIPRTRIQRRPSPSVSKPGTKCLNAITRQSTRASTPLVVRWPPRHYLGTSMTRKAPRLPTPFAD